MLAADIVVDTSAAVTSMVIPVNSFSVTDPACGTLVYEVPATTGVADISALVTYDDSTKSLTFTDINTYPNGEIVVTLNVW